MSCKVCFKKKLVDMRIVQVRPHVVEKDMTECFCRECNRFLGVLEDEVGKADSPEKPEC